MVINKTSHPEPSPNEIVVLKDLWAHGDSSAREVHERLEKDLAWAYSTTRTVLERMAEKGFVDKTSFHGLYLYTPKLSRPRALAAAVRSFAQRILEVPPEQVVSLFSLSEALPPEEIEQLRRLVTEDDDERG